MQHSGITMEQYGRRFDIPKSINCGGGQGRWTQYSIALPASANNNPNVKIGFRSGNRRLGHQCSRSFFCCGQCQVICIGTPIFLLPEYFQINPQTLTPCLNNLDPSLSAISCSEYWQIDRQQGSTARCYPFVVECNDLRNIATNDLRVSRCNSASMENRGNGGITKAYLPVR